MNDEQTRELVTRELVIAGIVMPELPPTHPNNTPCRLLN